jgi:glycosyltransferase involved in cell wall biosynthesis
MIKVLFLQHGLGYGGATKSLLLMQKALKDDIESYTILCRTKKINQDIKKEFIYSKEFVAMDIPSVYSYSEGTMKVSEFEKNILFNAEELVMFINKKKIDILHINSTVFSNIVRQVKEETACKIVVHLREVLPYGDSNIIDSFIIENYIRYADAVISISDNECKYFFQANKLEIIPNPHDFQVTDPLLEEDLPKMESIMIGMCANFNPAKGHLCFLETAGIVNDKLNNPKHKIEFRIIGYPKSKRSLKEFAKRVLSFGYKVRFDNKLKSLKIKNISILPFTFDIYSELRNFDIYVRPDLSGNPWGRDIIEAMALKKPVVATGDSEFFIKNGISGYLVPPDDPDKMAEKIIELVNDENIRIRMGKEGYEIVKEVCNMNSYRNKVMAVYNSIIQ